MLYKQTTRSTRQGGIYIVVLGTSMIVAVLGLSALVLQRLQNRMLTASADIRQAQLNAHAAVDLALLTTRGNDSWRSLLAADFLFTNKSTGAGSTCSVKITDAPADPTTATADRPITLVGFGAHGASAGSAPRTAANQRVELTVDPRRQPHDCLRQASAATPNWSTVFQYYSTNGTQIPLSSLPDRAKAYASPIDDRSFSRNPSVTNDDSYWYRADQVAPLSPEFASANVDRRLDVAGHQACMEIDRSSRRGGPANRLRASLLKPNTQYRIDVELYAGAFGNWFRAYLVTVTGSGYQVTTGSSASINAVEGLNWQTRSFTVTTPAWTTDPLNVYFAINSEPSGSNADFFIDNVDVYETNAKFIHQTVLGPGVNSFGATNQKGIYWIDCQGTTKLVIERSRIFGTLLLVNPGPGSCIDYGPINLSPAVPGYPALLVSNSGPYAFSIRATPDTTTDLTEAENGFNFNPTGAPHKTLGTNTNQNDAFDSEIRGLVLVSGNLIYANNPTIRGKVFVGGTIAGTPTIEYKPDSLLNPPPPLGVFYTYRYDRRPASTRKAVQP